MPAPVPVQLHRCYDRCTTYPRYEHHLSKPDHSASSVHTRHNSAPAHGKTITEERRPQLFASPSGSRLPSPARNSDLMISSAPFRPSHLRTVPVLGGTYTISPVLKDAYTISPILKDAYTSSSALRVAYTASSVLRGAGAAPARPAPRPSPGAQPARARADWSATRSVCRRRGTWSRRGARRGARCAAAGW